MNVLSLGTWKEKGTSTDREHEMDADNDGGRVKQMREVCKEYDREGVRREICRDLT